MARAERYIAAGSRTADWLTAQIGASSDVGGWPDDDSNTEPMGVDLYSGAAGVLLFFVQAYLTTAEARYASAAKRVADAIKRATADVGDDAALGLDGLAGAGLGLLRFHEVTGDVDALSAVTAIVGVLRDRAVEADGGVHWLDLNELLWGSAGIALFLKETDHAGLGGIDLSERAALRLLAIAERDGDILKWGFGEGTRAWHPLMPEERTPGFAHGAGGIAYVLAEIAEVTGREAFLDAAIGGARYVIAAGDREDGSFLPYRDEPRATEEFHYGWCYGPTGAASLFERLHRSTADPEWRELVLRCARTIRDSGLPARKYPGFWDNVGRCCGSVGVAEFFAGLYLATGQREHLDFACHVTDDLLARATDDETGLRWSNYEHRLTPPDLPAGLGWMQGASGIGAWLFRLAGILRGQDRSVRLPYSAWDPT